MTTDTTMTDRVCIVTGAAQGIGKAIAERLADEGARVVVADLNGELAATTAAELPGDALGVAVDVTDRAAVDQMAADVVEKYGRIDVLINNAGWDKISPFLELEPEVWDRIIAINLYGPLHTCQSVGKRMVEQGGGTIINIGSDAARVGSSGEAVYSACKGGVVSFTKTIAREFARYGVTANAVCPGPADTPLFASISEENPKLRTALEKAIPLRRLADPADLANAVAFLANPASSYITGQTLSVSGGLTMI
ncbi:SDR family NAD(P)-dependent oxidoreductase [Corynebacterium guangdongense]|uniref:2-hydroxycyclohexanecarboxyl-CoA dehydrogenase n=1 Tax=Corynebacterium guangdongense TaxID=1783348 RepID=A0ABU1ZTX5_9CORY|nr:glucose 1-dehydrogenase [Corynebacterium guangdongense]MDR7328382.1 2-hydroxycyclohexanecarboxyl-CoA dehydrogenase [Corynebacterium guangdongense]WJZ16959.1 3-oxoacyl-[acyl-carrier-protein] reductase FabG [Corynebacterium guangdongense]